MQHPEQGFSEAWPELARFTDRVLRARGVTDPLREDLVQETGLRLFQVWDEIDLSQPVQGLAHTIALNLLRDESRLKRNTEILGRVPERALRHDVEEIGMARMEIGRVGRALRQLTPDHRLILLRELGDESPLAARGPAATKMLRMRARRSLTRILEASACLVAAATVKVRRAMGPESAVALSAVAVAFALPGLVDVATPVPAEGLGRRDVAATSSDAAPPAVSKRGSAGSPPVLVLASSGEPLLAPVVDAPGPTRPVRVPIPGGEVSAEASVQVNNVSVVVGNNNGSIPVCVSGSPGVPSALRCDASPTD